MEIAMQVFSVIGMVAVGAGLFLGALKACDWVDDVNVMDDNLDEAMGDIQRLNREVSRNESSITRQQHRLDAIETAMAKLKK